MAEHACALSARVPVPIHAPDRDGPTVGVATIGVELEPDVGLSLSLSKIGPALNDADADLNATDVLIERHADGWRIFVHRLGLGGGDAWPVIEILADRVRIAHNDDRGTVIAERAVEPIWPPPRDLP